VADLNGEGKPDYVFADQGLDRVAVQYGDGGPAPLPDPSRAVLAPGAVRLADLNGDGIPDLIVANSGGNDVLVYLGQGNGRFGPAQSLFTGTDPTSVTVTHLGNGQAPDLVVTDTGSNDVTVLLGQGRGATWTLTPGPRLKLLDPKTQQAGLGPVSAAVADVTGPGGKPDGIPDLLVSNSQSNNVFVLPGVGGGFFNDGSPTVLPTPPGPGPIIPPPSPGGPITVLDPGSGLISTFPDLTGARQDTPVGGRPVAAVAGDFNGDGFPDLIVADNANGLVSLILGGPNGGTESVSTGDITHPTDLALAGQGNGQVLIDVVGSGSDRVLQLTLDEPFTPPPAPPQALPPPTTTFPSLPESDLAIVATVVIGDALAGVPSSGAPAAGPGASAFVVGLEGSFPTPTTTAAAGGGDAPNRPGPLDPDLSLLGKIFRERLPQVADQVAGALSPWAAGLDTVRVVPWAALSALGVNKLPLPELPLQQVADSFLQAGGAATRAVVEHFRNRLLDNSPPRPSAPDKPSKESHLPRTLPGHDEQRPAQAVSAEVVDAVFLPPPPDTDFRPVQGAGRLPPAVDHGNVDTEGSLSRLPTNRGGKESDRCAQVLAAVLWLFGPARSELRRDPSRRWCGAGQQPFLWGR
jgi:hypothetical protein